MPHLGSHTVSEGSGSKQKLNLPRLAERGTTPPFPSVLLTTHQCAVRWAPGRQHLGGSPNVSRKGSEAVPTVATGHKLPGHLPLV